MKRIITSAPRFRVLALLAAAVAVLMLLVVTTVPVLAATNPENKAAEEFVEVLGFKDVGKFRAFFGLEEDDGKGDYADSSGSIDADVLAAKLGYDDGDDLARALGLDNEEQLEAYLEESGSLRELDQALGYTNVRELARELGLDSREELAAALDSAADVGEEAAGTGAKFTASLNQEIEQEAESAGQTQASPNIVFIKTDDQPESTLAHMPNVQNLIKARGRTFNNAFNALPLCCPSRATMQRGQYAHNTGIFGNEPQSSGGYQTFDELNLEQSTIATWMDAAGYRTIHVGKYMNGFRLSLYSPPPWWDAFNRGLNQTGETNTATQANRAMAELRDAAPRAAPFYMEVGFEVPHTPNDYESRYEGMFADERVPRVPGFDEQNVEDKPRYIREDKPPLAQQTNPEVSEVCQDNEPTSIEQNDCEYIRMLRSLQTVDHFVKSMTDYLASQGELSNTYIVYYTDNGTHWGEHRLDYGKLAPYETDTGFPLMIRGPNIPAGTTSNKLIGNQDIPLTFAEIGRATTPSFVDGRSFLGVADADLANDSPWRTALYSERRWKSEWKLFGTKHPQYVPPWEAVREENLVYIRYGDDPWTAVNDEGFEEFYDLSDDPYEERNLAYYKEVPQATLDRLRGRLLNLRGCQGDACRAAEG